MQILRFHDLIAKIGIAKIGIAKIGIPILAIHPDRDPDFSDPDFSDPDFSNPDLGDDNWHFQKKKSAKNARLRHFAKWPWFDALCSGI